MKTFTLSLIVLVAGVIVWSSSQEGGGAQLRDNLVGALKNKVITPLLTPPKEADAAAQEREVSGQPPIGSAFYLKERISDTSEHGVHSIAPGTQVVISEHRADGTVVVSDNRVAVATTSDKLSYAPLIEKVEGADPLVRSEVNEPVVTITNMRPTPAPTLEGMAKDRQPVQGNVGDQSSAEYWAKIEKEKIEGARQRTKLQIMAHREAIHQRRTAIADLNRNRRFSAYLGRMNGDGPKIARLENEIKEYEGAIQRLIKQMP